MFKGDEIKIADERKFFDLYFLESPLFQIFQDRPPGNNRNPQAGLDGLTNGFITAHLSHDLEVFDVQVDFFKGLFQGLSGSRIPSLEE